MECTRLNGITHLTRVREQNRRKQSVRTKSILLFSLSIVTVMILTGCNNKVMTYCDKDFCASSPQELLELRKYELKQANMWDGDV